MQDKPSRSSSATRRYGSIRVAECSFIEAESQPSTPTEPTYNQPRQRQYSLSYCLPNEAEPAQTEAAINPSLPPPAICNGPLGSAIVTSGSTGNRQPPQPPPRGPQYGNNGQQSHIIPPPHNFSNNGDYTPLTTTRIGSSLNLASRPPAQPPQPTWRTGSASADRQNSGSATAVPITTVAASVTVSGTTRPSSDPPF